MEDGKTLSNSFSLYLQLTTAVDDKKSKYIKYKFQNSKHFWLKTKKPILDKHQNTFSAKEKKSKNIILTNLFFKAVIVSSWIEVPWISKSFLLSEKPRSGAAFPWLNDKTQFAKLAKCLNLYCPASSRILPIFEL